MRKSDGYVIGVDFGTDTVRSLILDAATGQEVASAVFAYPRWRDGLFCNPEQNRFRQHPLDYIEGLEASVRECVINAGPAIAGSVVALSVDTTGSTPVAVDRSGTPLSLLPQFANNPNAMFVLWKDHTAIRESAEINAHARKFPVNYLRFVGGIYSSEWFWSKLLHILREDTVVRDACYSFVEHCDWIPFLLTGGQDVLALKRSICAAGHKALWAKEFGGLPPAEFFTSLDPLLGRFAGPLYMHTYSADQAAGTLSPHWAQRLGLPGNVIVGVGAFDAHMGAVGGQIEPYHLSKVMGTSTCDMLVAPADEVGTILVKGICGQVPGSVVPGMIGMEAGQSAFGDTYAWFRKLISSAMRELWQDSSIIDAGLARELLQELDDNLITRLSREAARLPLSPEDELAVDWLNGRRTPDANQELKAAVMNLDLATDATRFFRGLVESTCFGARAIVERFTGEGIPVRGLIGLGGVARKSPYIMQMMADVLEMPIRIHKTEHTCATGAAMFAATAAGIYERVEDAMTAMGQGFDAVYHPRSSNGDLYRTRYEKFKRLGRFVVSESGPMAAPGDAEPDPPQLIHNPVKPIR